MCPSWLKGKKHLKIYIRNAIPIGKKENVNNTVHVSPESMYIKSL